MSGNAKSSLLDRLISSSLGLLIGAVALYVAVRLVEAVATGLVIIGGTVLVISLVVVVLRHRSNSGW